MRKFSSFFSFRRYHPFSKIRILYSIFLQKSNKVSFLGKKFSRRNSTFENRDHSLSVRYLVDKPSCRRFLKYLENHSIFDFFFCFPYEARHSAVFHRRVRKCMSGNSSVLFDSESVRFKKQMLIFYAIFEKIIAKYISRIKIGVLETRS